jgi:hypothetical protein
MSDAEVLDPLVETTDLVQLHQLRRRFEVAATEAAAIAAEAEQMALRLRNRAQWLTLQEEYRRRRRALTKPGG